MRGKGASEDQSEQDYNKFLLKYIFQYIIAILHFKDEKLQVYIAL